MALRRGRGVSESPAAIPVSAILTSKLRLLGVALVCAKVALVPVVFDYAADQVFPLAKGLLSHALAYALAAVIAVLVIRFQTAFLRWSPLHVPVVAFFAVNVVATVFAANSTIALFGTHARMLGLALTLDLVVLYIAIVLLVRTSSDAVALGAATFGASLVVLAYEAIQLAGRDPFPWDPVFVTRPFSTLGQPTVLAQYLTVLAVGAFVLASVARLHLLVRAVLLAYSAAALAGAVATGTRSQLIGLGAGVAIFVALVWLVHPMRRARIFSLAGGALVTVAATAVLLFTPLGARLAATIEDPRTGNESAIVDRVEPSVAARLVLYGIGLNMVRERPLLGYGPDNFTVGVPRYRPEQAPELVRQDTVSSAHSWLIHVATDSGLLGVGCFIAIAIVALGLALRDGFRVAAVTGVAAMAAWLGTGITTVNDVGTEWLFWAGAGTVAAATAVPITASASNQKVTRHRQKITRRRLRGRSLATTTAATLILVGAALAVIATPNAVRASRLAHDSEITRLTGDGAGAVNLGESATRADAGRANYWHTLGLAYVATLRWRDAADALERATALAPYDVAFIGDLARVEIVLSTTGNGAARARALQLGDRATQVDPNNPQAHLTRAVARQATTDYPEAMLSIERALRLDPNSSNERLYITAVQVMLSSGRPDDAVQTARKGLAILVRIVQPYELTFELARALTMLRQFSDALVEVEKALAMRPNYPQAEQLRAALRAELAKQGTPP